MAYNYDELYNDLTTVSVHSKLYKTVQKAVKRRGNWKNKPRGAWVKHGVVGSRLK